jgi:hypothetical protein
MRLIATDWIALILVATLIVIPLRRRLDRNQAAAVYMVALLAVLPFLALPFFEPARVSAATIDFDPRRALQLPLHDPLDFYLTYGVEAVRWMQGCALLTAVVVIAPAERRWNRVADWAIAGSTLNCLYGIYQASRFWLGLVGLPLLPFTFGRHVTLADGYYRATGFMWEPTVFGSFTALMLMLVLFRLTRVPSKASWAALVLHVAALNLSFSTIGWAAGVVGWSVLLLVPAAARVKGTLSTYPPRLIAATGVACVVVALLNASSSVQWRFEETIRKVAVASENAPLATIQKQRVLSAYSRSILPRFGDFGLGMGQMAYVSGDALSLPLKVWAEQGVLGLSLMLGVGALVVFRVWHCCRTQNIMRAAVAAALLASLSLVVATQGKSKINFVFFFSGLLLALPQRVRCESPDAVPRDLSSNHPVASNV